MRAYSTDLRQRVVDFYHRSELTLLEVAEQFGVSESFVYDMVRLDREVGSVEPRPHGGGKPRTVDADGERLIRKLVGQTPDATQPELCEAYEKETGASVSAPTVCRILKRLGLTRKKNASRQRRRDA